MNDATYTMHMQDLPCKYLYPLRVICGKQAYWMHGSRLPVQASVHFCTKTAVNIRRNVAELCRNVTELCRNVMELCRNVTELCGMEDISAVLLF